MNQNLNKTASPVLRFPEFRAAEGWAETTLSENAKLITEKAGTNRYTLMSITAGVGLVSQIEKFGREIAGEAYKNYYVIQKGDFAYNKSSTKLYPEGQISILENQEQGAVPNSIFTCFRVNEQSVLPSFLKHPFSNNIHGAWLQKFISVGARANGALNVDSKDLLALPLLLPSLAEQQKIAHCLAALDAVISAASQKVTALKAHKIGLMQQLFPAEGETVPPLRFPEFRESDEWEDGLLGEVADFSSGGTPSKNVSEYWGGDIPWISAASMHNTIIDQSDSNITEKAVKDGAQMAQKGVLLMLVRGSMLHKRIPIGITTREVAFNQDVKALKLDPKMIVTFLLYLLNAAESRLLSAVTITGIGAGKLDTNELKQFSITIPSKAEQQKIAACLSSLDDYIKAESDRLEALKAHKQGLMQVLFPNPLPTE